MDSKIKEIESRLSSLEKTVKVLRTALFQFLDNESKELAEAKALIGEAKRLAVSAQANVNRELPSTGIQQLTQERK